MTAFDDPRALNMEALLDTIYSIQTDLKLLAEYLARESNPSLHDRAILALAYLQADLQRYTPSLYRH
jgi:hypothetical protein